MRIAIYPGSFDPITNGHIDIIKRGAKLFDKLYIVLAVNLNKNSLFTTAEKIELIEKSVGNLDNVEIVTSSGTLTVDFADKLNACVILRGLRSLTDFEYEFSMAMTNANLNPNIETVFLTADNKYTYLSSSLVKEVAKFKGDISGFVPDFVATAIIKKNVEQKEE